MSTLSLVVVFIAFTFNAIYALVVQIPKEDGREAFRISVRWPIFIINSVDKTKHFCILLPHRRSTTVSLETTPSFKR